LRGRGGVVPPSYPRLKWKARECRREKEGAERKKLLSNGAESFENKRKKKENVMASQTQNRIVVRGRRSGCYFKKKDASR